MAAEADVWDVFVHVCHEQLKDQMNKQTGMHDGIFEVLSRINSYVREGHTLPT